MIWKQPCLLEVIPPPHWLTFTLFPFFSFKAILLWIYLHSLFLYLLPIVSLRWMTIVSQSVKDAISLIQFIFRAGTNPRWHSSLHHIWKCIKMHLSVQSSSSLQAFKFSHPFQPRNFLFLSRQCGVIPGKKMFQILLSTLFFIQWSPFLRANSYK